ncbi:NADPH:quinone oxidoreductase family protein [Sphingobium tyrosinilyticum]|uniref:NADPH:quinone oxidoreductase family protein n=1 Tax=Sphingobium tyrosinilyticum TaxID=2715436 RepID=A0ABV9F0S6_9SPHN
MRAFQLTDYVGPDGLVPVDVPEPTPGQDELLVDVKAIGINFPDLLMTKGQYQFRPELPAIPGCEISGDVLTAPAGSGLQTGDRVAAFIWQGGFAERATVPLRAVMPISQTMDHADAAAIVVNYHTVHFALSRRGHIRAGERVLVMGAGGGIGTAAIQIANGFGAHVIAGVANEAQIAVARAAGAADVLTLEPGFAKAVKVLSGDRGVDIVVDPVGDWLFDEALRVLAPEGRLLVIGFAAGEIPQVKVNRLLLRNISVVGAAFGAFLDLDPGLMAEQGRSLMEMAAAGHVRPQIGQRFSFAELPTALNKLSTGGIAGKAVVAL